ncbi:hypothetical protein Tco_1251405 [Tanacetum coccineum]
MGMAKKHEDPKLENKTSTSTSVGDYVFSNYSHAYSEEALDIEYKSYVSRKPTPRPANAGSESGHKLENKTSTSTSAGDYVFSNYSCAYTKEALDNEYKSYVSRKPTPRPANAGSESGHRLDPYKVSRDVKRVLGNGLIRVSLNPSSVVLQLSLGWSFFLRCSSTLLYSVCNLLAFC